VATFCSNCGNVLKSGQPFCTGCGAKIERENSSLSGNFQPMERATIKQSALQRNNKNTYIGVFSILGIIFVLIAAYFIMKTLNEQEQVGSSSSPVTTEDSKNTSVSREKDNENSEEVSTKDDEALINSYSRKLNSLKVNTAGQDISTGRWDITNKNGTLFLKASDIPSRDLTRIFDLYDVGNLNPLKAWAQEVYFLAEDLSRDLDTNWNIDVGNSCVSEYPVTISNSKLMKYSGSCGYSIPVLSGTDKGNLSLVIDSLVFFPSDIAETSIYDEYIFPDSGFRRLSSNEIAPLSLEQLGLARNEIFARHGHVFTKEDLRVYFEQKSWYLRDDSYKDETNDIEKYNIDLIKSREEYLK
jgi:hypothetical protein